MRSQIVTSFSVEGAELYGRRCVESLERHWLQEVVVYADEPMRLPVETRLTTDIPRWPSTRASLPAMKPGGAPKPHSYIWNAQRFAVKPFVWHHAAKMLKEGMLIWIDGDTVTTKDVPPWLVFDLLKGVDVAFLGRRAMHPETGFVAFRLPEALELLKWCRDAYVKKQRFRSLVGGWTDCHVLRAGLSAVHVRARDLTSKTYKGKWRSNIDAMARSPLGPYVEHLKGTRRKREAAA